MAGDAAPSRFWFDDAALSPRSGLGRLRPPARGDRLADFATANGMVLEVEPEGEYDALVGGYRPWIDDLLVFDGQPRVEFGNAGTKVNLGSADFLPSRFGIVALRHGLALPHALAGFNGMLGAKTVANVASAAINVLGMFDGESADADVSPLSRFRSKGELVCERKTSGLSVVAAPGDEAAARELITATAAAELVELTRSFEIEIRADWMYAYSFYGEVSTTDPEIWAWVFSSASRMIDLASLWREGWPPVDASVPVRPPDLREIPFYTPRRVPRPGKVDGVFSKASVTRFKRGT